MAFHLKQDFSRALSFPAVFHIPLCPWSIACSLGFLSVSIDCEQKSFNYEGHTWNWGKSGDIHLTNFLKTNVTKFAVIWVKRHQKARFLSMRSSKITATKKKERRKRKNKEKERRRRKKKAVVALLVFIIVTLEIPKIDRERILYTQF